MCGKLEITEFKMRGEGSHEPLQDKWIKNTAIENPLTAGALHVVQIHVRSVELQDLFPCVQWSHSLAFCFLLNLRLPLVHAELLFGISPEAQHLENGEDSEVSYSHVRKSWHHLPLSLPGYSCHNRELCFRAVYNDRSRWELSLGVHSKSDSTMAHIMELGFSGLDSFYRLGFC